MTHDTNTAPPSIFLHVCTVYTRMKEEAIQIPTEEGEISVYEGYFTKMVTQDLNLAIPYYSAIIQALKGMGCAEQLKRGGGSSMSRWRLLKEPTYELYVKFEESNSVRKGPTSKAAMQQGQIKDLGNRVSALEEAFSEVLGMIREAS